MYVHVYMLVMTVNSLNAYCTSVYLFREYISRKVHNPSSHMNNINIYIFLLASRIENGIKRGVFTNSGRPSLLTPLLDLFFYFFWWISVWLLGDKIHLRSQSNKKKTFSVFKIISHKIILRSKREEKSVLNFSEYGNVYEYVFF